MKKSPQANRERAKIVTHRKFLLFSSVLFVLISLLATVGYFFAARQINHTYVGQRLIITGEAIKSRVASEISADLTLLLNLRTSTVIQDYFMNPVDPELRELAFAEFDTFQQDSTEGAVFWVNTIDREIHFIGAAPLIVDPRDPDAHWFNQTLYETEDHNFEITFDRDTGMINLWVTVPVFAAMEDGEEKSVGIVGIGFDMAEITRIITYVHRAIHEDIVCYMFNQNREITSALNTRLVAHRISLAAHLGDVGTEAIRVANMLDNEIGRNYVYGNYMYRVGIVPIIPGWNIMMRIPLPGLLALNQPMNMVFFSMLGLIFVLFIIINVFVARSNKAMAEAHIKLAKERDIIQAMKDNIHQGIFLMDTELKILPQYSTPLIGIFSYHDSDLEGKNLLDILSSSLDTKELQTMKDFFEMMFSKTADAEVLESANPISEFEYKIVDGQMKILSTRFHLIEQSGSEPVIVGVIQDITREKEFEKELLAQKEAQQLEMKNIFDVFQIDPLVFQDFIEDTESNFNFINTILKDKSLTEKQVVTKMFQNIHAIKSNAFVLGLETFGKNLHKLENEIKALLSNNAVSMNEVLRLAVELETIMQEKDSYVKIVKKIDTYKTANQISSILVYSLAKAVESTASEVQKKVEIKAEELDKEILESNLRKPIKDILFQCVRNSIYHGIETVEERIKKNKKPQGLLVVSLKRKGEKAELFFSDDGGGLNWDKIKARYLQQYPNAKDTSKKVLLSSIFSSGFSTSKTATSVAGQGVGLSLVKDLVKENGGEIKVDSSDDGLSFRFIFPLQS